MSGLTRQSIIVPVIPTKADSHKPARVRSMRYHKKGLTKESVSDTWSVDCQGSLRCDFLLKSCISFWYQWRRKKKGKKEKRGGRNLQPHKQFQQKHRYFGQPVSSQLFPRTPHHHQLPAQVRQGSNLSTAITIPASLRLFPRAQDTRDYILQSLPTRQE